MCRDEIKAKKRSVIVRDESFGKHGVSAAVREAIFRKPLVAPGRLNGIEQREAVLDVLAKRKKIMIVRHYKRLDIVVSSYQFKIILYLTCYVGFGQSRVAGDTHRSRSINCDGLQSNYMVFTRKNDTHFRGLD